MNLLKALFSILAMWRSAFCKEEAFTRTKELAIACLCASGRKTIASFAIFLGRSFKLPIADYKFYSECKWNVEDLFNPILAIAAQYATGNYLCFAADDTRLRKTGKRSPKHVGMPIPWGLNFEST